MKNSEKSPSSSTQYKTYFAVLASLIAASIVGFYLYYESERKIDIANNERQSSFQLANELLKSSSDLTEMAQSYVVTGHPLFKQAFKEIIDIRDGKLPRPRSFHSKEYWDLSRLERPRNKQDFLPPAALLDRMRHHGFTEQEFQLLREAKTLSDELTHTESTAIALYDQPGPRSKERRDQARSMLFDAHYFQVKTEIMSRIDDFFKIMDVRTKNAIRTAETQSSRLRLFFLGVSAMMTVLFFHIFYLLNTTAVNFLMAKEDAEKASRLKSQFLDIAAHELRTPVTAFSLLLQLTEKQLLQGKSVSSDTLQRLRRQADRISKLVVDLLDVSRLERGITTLRVTPTLIGKLISDCLFEFRTQCPKRTITFYPLDTDIELKVDPIRIQQVIANLLDNAAKYSEENQPIEVYATSSENKVSISVVDHGPGLSAEQISGLFQPFSRGKTSIEEITPGLGLGLYLCQKLIELHHGQIRVTSELGKGSNFFFELPRRDEIRKGGEK